MVMYNCYLWRSDFVLNVTVIQASLIFIFVLILYFVLILTLFMQVNVFFKNFILSPFRLVQPSRSLIVRFIFFHLFFFSRRKYSAIWF
jgi:hypothetical protein